jgi:hypothetical protein
MAAETFSINPNVLTTTIEFLTAMITPALLISACGSLVLSTSTRLGRVIDRVRQLTAQLEELITVKDKSSIPLYSKKLEMTFDLLDKVTTRSRILQRAMVTFYLGLGCFVLTSVTIGFVGLFNIYRGLPIYIGLVGIIFILYGSFLMIREARMATAAVNAEMDYTWNLAREVAPQDLAQKYPNVRERRKLFKIVGKRGTTKTS